MSKLIVQNDSSCSDAQALQYVMTVIREGRISDHGRAYCYLTRFMDGVVVAAIRNERSDRFVVQGGEK